MKHTRNIAEVLRRVERRQSVINALIRGMYDGHDTSIQPVLTGLDDFESTGFDPYNSGSFDKSKLRSSGSGK